MRGAFSRSPRRRATWWRARRAKAWCGSAFRRISRLTGSPSSCRNSSARDRACGSLCAALERGELDLALIKRDPGDGDAIAAWPERLHWVTSRDHPVDVQGDPLPLVTSDQGCLYRNHAIHTLEAAGRSWHIAFSSPNLTGLQAAVSAGLGIGILPEVAILADHRMLGSKNGLPA